MRHDDLLYRLLADARPAALPRALAEQLFQSVGWRAVSPVLLVAGLEHVMRQQPYSSSLPTPTERWMPTEVDGEVVDGGA